MKKSQKTGFLRPISSKIALAMKKEKRNRKSEEGEKRRREKSNGCFLSLTLSTFGVFGQKSCLKNEFYLALAFSKI